MLSELILIMGVSGTGKSTLANALAQQIYHAYFDADDFHSTLAKDMMKTGQPITTEMRDAWVNEMLTYFSDERFDNGGVILAYSGLKQAHRNKFLSIAQNVIFVLIEPDKDLLIDRLTKRTTHFFSPKLLSDQLIQMEQPTSEELQRFVLLPMALSTEQQITHIKSCSELLDHV